MRYLFFNIRQKETQRQGISKKGFTVVELLLVITIIGILAGIAVPLFLSQRTRALHSEAKTNLENLLVLEEQYFAENGCYYKSGGACQDTTISGVSSIQAFLPAFKPGNTNTLNFDYRIVTNNNAAEFNAIAVGKNNTSVASATFWINQDNERGGF